MISKKIFKESKNIKILKRIEEFNLRISSFLLLVKIIMQESILLQIRH